MSICCVRQYHVMYWKYTEQVYDLIFVLRCKGDNADNSNAV